MNNGELPIHYGYMQFSTDVSSRAQLVTDMKGKTFGVLGYQYSSTTNWATAKPIALPSVFYNQMVSCDENGTCTYDAYPSDSDKSLKEWEEGNYTFFAYHPYTDGNETGITLSNSTTTNTPTLTYTYPWLNGTDTDEWFEEDFETMDNKGNIVKLDVVKLCEPSAPIFDVMTAEAIDVNGRGNGTVSMDFKHRMFALEVLANNYNENEYQVDANGEYVLDDNGQKIIIKSARQSIDDLVLTLNGLQHSSMTIPMSMQSGEIPDYDKASPGTRSFVINDKKVIVPAFNERYEGRGEGIATSVSKLGGYDGNAGYLMLIPQGAGALSGTLHWNQLENFPGTISTSFSSSIEFKAGRLYQLYINYVGSGITIALIEAGAWDVHDVEHKFE